MPTSKLLSFGCVVIGACLLLSRYQADISKLSNKNRLVERQQQASSPVKRKYKDEVCSFLPSSDTNGIWMDHMKELLEWSIHPLDVERYFETFTAKLLRLVSTERLQRSIKTLPHRYWTSVKHIISTVRTRYDWLQQQKTGDEPRRLHILVMGGSVAEGDMCNPHAKVDFQQRRRTCAWPFRLNATLHRMFGDVVELTTSTLGGTNTESAVALLEYDLVPKDVDIVIHAYSTNDMHLYTLESAGRNNVTLRDRIIDLTEQFFRSALQRCRKSKAPPPLVIYLDDYIGNEQNNIMGAALLAQSIPWLANYYGVMSISYADAVRELVYGDTLETFFSPRWVIFRTKRESEWVRQIHPGMGMHITMTYMLLYGMLQATTTFCTLPRGFGRTSDGKAAYMATSGFPELDGKEQAHYQEPRLPPEYLPPRMYPDLTLDTVTTQWRHRQRAPNCKDSHENRCVFAWMSRITSNCLTEEHLNSIMAEHMVQNQHWEPELQYKKLGFVARGKNSTTPPKFVLGFKNISQPINSVMLTVMKSYGPKWEESRVLMSSSAGPLSISSFGGYHGKNTSEQYSYVSQFDEGPVVGDFELVFELTAGKTFKIMGMALCT